MATVDYIMSIQELLRELLWFVYIKLVDFVLTKYKKICVLIINV